MWFPAEAILGLFHRGAQESDGQRHDPEQENADVDALPNPYPRCGQICRDPGASNPVKAPNTTRSAMVAME